MTVNPSKIEEFIQFIEPTMQKIQQFKGCEHLEFLKDKNEKNIFFSYSMWESEDSLENYRKSKLFKEFWATVKQWFVKDTQAWTVDNIFDRVPKK